MLEGNGDAEATPCRCAPIIIMGHHDGMEPTDWIAIGMIVAFIVLGLLYGYLRNEVLQRHDDEGEGPTKK